MSRNLNKPKILQIYDLLEKSPKIQSLLPCDLKNFKKMVLFMEQDLLDKIYATLLVESQTHASKR